MKKVFVTVVMVCFMTGISSAQDIDYKQRSAEFMLGGHLALVATAACVPGAYFTEINNENPAKNEAALQTRTELRNITYVTGAAALTCYTMAFISHRKAKRQKPLSFFALPGGMMLSYTF